MKTDPNHAATARPYGSAMTSANSGSYNEPTIGLTKRELFAAMAMQGLASRETDISYEVEAACSVLRADALIAELNREAPTT